MCILTDILLGQVDDPFQWREQPNEIRYSPIEKWENIWTWTVICFPLIDSLQQVLIESVSSCESLFPLSNISMCYVYGYIHEYRIAYAHVDPVIFPVCSTVWFLWKYWVSVLSSNFITSETLALSKKLWHHKWSNPAYSL